MMHSIVIASHRRAKRRRSSNGYGEAIQLRAGRRAKQKAQACGTFSAF
jgi:hypothetical protein